MFFLLSLAILMPQTRSDYPACYEEVMSMWTLTLTIVIRGEHWNWRLPSLREGPGEVLGLGFLGILAPHIAATHNAKVIFTTMIMMYYTCCLEYKFRQRQWWLFSRFNQHMCGLDVVSRWWQQQLLLIWVWWEGTRKLWKVGFCQIYYSNPIHWF